jgi:hypothetical protein
MKKINMIIAVVILAFITGSSSNAPAGDSGPKILKVKGLYLGMNIDDGAKIFEKFIDHRFAWTYGQSETGQGEPLKVTLVPPFETCNYGFGYFSTGCPEAFLKSDCSNEKKVYHIYIHNDIADKMFDAKGLSQEEFVQSFEHAHNITMRLKEKPSLPGGSSSKSWEFESPHGYKVTIDAGHTIVVEQVAQENR